jgi:hypothetical protein
LDAVAFEVPFFTFLRIASTELLEAAFATLFLPFDGADSSSFAVPVVESPVAAEGVLSKREILCCKESINSCRLESSRDLLFSSKVVFLKSLAWKRLKMVRVRIRRSQEDLQ